VQVKSLKDVAAASGLPASFAEPWPFPATAVQAYPPNANEGNPSMAPANPADPEQLKKAKEAPGTVK